MKTTTKLFSTLAMLSIVIFVTLSVAQAVAEKSLQAAISSGHTKIKVNGLSSDVILVDDSAGTNGFLNVGRDEIADTTTLDFSYATPDTTNSEIVHFIQGSGEIPNSGFTINLTTAHLATTTTFPINSCVVNVVTADFDCEVGSPISFDLTWTKNGFGSIREKSELTQTFGPVTTKFKGEFESVTAIVNGIWTGHTAADLSGNLVDSKNNINTREIIINANP